MSMPPSLPLFLKLAAAAITGTAAFLTCYHVHRNDTLQARTSDIRDALRNVTKPPAIYVLGFKGHGKSSFINTTCRVLSGEDGPLVFRAETAPVGPKKATTLKTRAVHVAAPEGCGVTLVDTPGLSPERLTRADVEGLLGQVPGEGGTPPVDCVAFVLRCTDEMKEWHLAVRRLADVAAVIHDQGLQLVVVITHIKALKSTNKQAELLRMEVAMMARTDCIYFMENYTADVAIDGNRLMVIRNNFDTHNVVLVIMRQCIEFTAIHHSDLANKISNVAPSADRLMAIRDQ